MKELKKYIPVDVYGECGPYNCTGRMSEECYRYLEKNYMFYLAFENSICKDYVTEKFFNAVKYDFVPVVFGGANYSSVLASMNNNQRRGSGPGKWDDSKVFIDGLKFPSPKDLARHLVSLSENEDAYFEYFKWRSSHEVRNHWSALNAKW